MPGFEELYISIRDKEGRTYPDETVKILPEVPPTHPHYAEWMVRKRSALRLVRYLARKKQPLHILEVGCGNGWLCHWLSRIPGATVTGLDINHTELEQALRVFRDVDNIRFVDEVKEMAADIEIIIFSASIQYFPVLEETLQWSLRRLTPGGEIHILDSPFYDTEELVAAQKRSMDHFAALGFPGMATYYHFHTRCIEALQTHSLVRPEVCCLQAAASKRSLCLVLHKK
jgi:ubiquinone/menaquinone biosynthesis C-methylase UbiE